MPISSSPKWHYILVIPVEAVAAAEPIAESLNPDGIIETFQRFPMAGEGEYGQYSEPATHYFASFIAFDLASEGAPSREALEAAMLATPGLSSALWIRVLNPEHPDTLPEQKCVVVDSNWAAFPVGATVSNAAVVEVLGAL